MASYCCFPCQLCGKGCDAVGRCLGSGCQGCNDCAREGCCPLTRPSPIFLSFTVLFNGPVALAAMVIAFENLGNDCRHPLHTFLLVQAFIFNLFMILFAVRMYQQFSSPYLEDSPPRRAGRLCWRDPVVCLMFLAAPCTLAVSITGLVWASEAGFSCPTELTTMTVWSCILMIVYLSSFWIVMLVSLCVECGRFSAARYDVRYMGRYNGQHPPPPSSSPGDQQPAGHYPPPQHPPMEPNLFQKIGSDVGHYFYPTAPPYYEVEAGMPPPGDGQGFYPPIFGQPAVGVPVGDNSGYVPPSHTHDASSSQQQQGQNAANKA
mmetsp:Transcript_29713/g.53241  ORF Transcript_29713/g.53241 Transcript_29713/m.53241 type:complete len:319 (-) Transcript_29713:69-1025(-)